MDGSTVGPKTDALRFLNEKLGEVDGFWVFLPRETFLTGLDDLPL